MRKQGGYSPSEAEPSSLKLPKGGSPIVPLKNREQVLTSLKRLDAFFFKPNDPNSPTRMEAAGQVEALLETFDRQRKKPKGGKRGC